MASKVLLVEDDNNLREIYEARLQAEGYTIATAKDGEEALVVAKAEKPDLIISDVMMPRISGFEMLDILRNTDELKYTKVIMLTALGQADDKTRADSLGADRYLVKSQVTLEDIVKAAHELTDAPVAAPAPSVPAPTTVSTQTIPVAAPPTAMPPQPTQEPVTLPVSMPPMATPPTDTPPQIPVAQPTETVVVTPPVAPTAPTPILQAPPVVATAPSLTTPTQPSVPGDAPAVPSMPPVAPSPSVAPITPAVPAAPSAPQPAMTMQPPVPVVSPAPEPRPSYMTDYSSAGTRPTVEPTTQAQTETPPVAKQPRPADIINAASTAEEQATIGAQIADFANAPVVPVAEAPAQTEAAANDDAVLANAVTNLSNSAPTASAPVTTPVPAPTPAPDTLPSLSPLSDSVTIANKKIIQPIKGDPKPGLDELLAREEARTDLPSFGQVVTSSPATGQSDQPSVPPSTTAPAIAPTPVSAPVQQIQPQTPPSQTTATTSDFDPNNIAL